MVIKINAYVSIAAWKERILSYREAIMAHYRPLGTNFEVTGPEDSNDCDVSSWKCPEQENIN